MPKYTVVITVEEEYTEPNVKKWEVVARVGDVYEFGYTPGLDERRQRSVKVLEQTVETLDLQREQLAERH